MKINKYTETSRESDFEFETYIVEKSDSSQSIAWNYKVNMFTLASINDKSIFTTIPSNDKLKIPKN